MLKLFCILDYKVIFIHFQIVDYIFLILNDFALVNFFYCMRKILVNTITLYVKDIDFFSMADV